MSNLTVEERLKRLERAVYLMTWYADKDKIQSSALPDILQEFNGIIWDIEAEILEDRKNQNGKENNT